MYMHVHLNRVRDMVFNTTFNKLKSNYHTITTMTAPERICVISIRIQDIAFSFFFYLVHPLFLMQCRSNIIKITTLSRILDL